MTISKADVQQALTALGVDLQHERFTLVDVVDGANVELEHTSDLTMATKIAIDHLRERANYYPMLFRAEHPWRYAVGLVALGFGVGWLVTRKRR